MAGAGGTRRARDHEFYDVAIALCGTCLRKVEGKILLADGGVWLAKRCPEHGAERVLLADDVEYWRRARERFLKPSELPRRFQTPVRFGCPYDCGLCADHEQHSCLTLVEITDHCNLACPVCYAESGPSRESHRSLAEIERMLDAVVDAEGEPDVVQLSGGEPTIHPDFFAVLDAARRRPIRHLMVNTNGVRIARDPAFAERLASYGPGFEVYLQFDSFERDALVALRGADLRDVRLAAVERLNELGLSTTLVVTVARGTNDGELGRIVEWAAGQPAVRGVTFQPVQAAGRLEGYDPARGRLTLTEVRRKLLEQQDLFRAADVIPVPCHPECIAMAYGVKTPRASGGLVPLTGLVDPDVLLAAGRDTIAYEAESELHRKLFEALSLAHSPASGATSLKELLCCLPEVALPEGFGYEHLFRVIVMQFLDADSLELRSVKKSCVQVVHPEDGRMIPVDTYNLLYRGALERERLGPLRGGVLA